MEPNTDANEMPVDVWVRAGAALSAWEKQEASREFQRGIDQAAYAEAAFRQLRAAQQARHKEQQDRLINWLIFAALAAGVLWGICEIGFQ